ncbi:unnamed protein product, partial [Staurois parvus]
MSCSSAPASVPPHQYLSVQPISAASPVPISAAYQYS